jgi:RND superfamily putative drug exporter
MASKTQFAVGAILVVSATVVASITLLPAVLGLLGDSVNWLPVPLIGRRGRREAQGGLWDWITRAVTARPIISVAVTGGLLVAAATPVLSINLGSVGISSLPGDSNSRHAFDVISDEFSDGVLSADIVIDAPDTDDAAVQRAIFELTTLIGEDEFFGG